MKRNTLTTTMVAAAMAAATVIILGCVPGEPSNVRGIGVSVVEVEGQRFACFIAADFRFDCEPLK